MGGIIMPDWPISFPAKPVDHKDNMRLLRWVDEHKDQDERGWWICDSPGWPSQGPYATEQEVDDILWPRAFEEAH